MTMPCSPSPKVESIRENLDVNPGGHRCECGLPFGHDSREEPCFVTRRACRPSLARELAWAASAACGVAGLLCLVPVALPLWAAYEVWLARNPGCGGGR